MSLTWLKWHRELSGMSTCVVGEAHGHSSMYVYNCSKCNSFGYKIFYYFTLNWHGKLQHNKLRFVEHWNERHSENNTI